MKIKIINIGKTDVAYLKAGIQIYLEKLKHYTTIEFVEIPNVKMDGTIYSEKIKEMESIVLEKYFSQADINILLDENGKKMSSLQFADMIESYQLRAVKTLHFYIGGAYGFSKNISQKADLKLSLSDMTFTHLMVRLLFLEQLYRAYTIIKKEKYHHI